MNKLLLIFLLGSFTAVAQDYSDIGVRYELGVRQMVAADLRIPVANRLKLDVSAGYQPNRLWEHWRDYDYVMDLNDSILSRRFQTYDRKNWEIQSGLTYQLPWKYFSVSTGLTFSFQREYVHNYTEYYRHDPSQSNYYELYTAEHLDKQEANQKRWSAVQGFRQGFHFHLPIGEKFIIGASFVQMIWASFTFRSWTSADPLDEIWGDWLGFDEALADARFTLNVRYKFGKEKTFKPFFRRDRE